MGKPKEAKIPFSAQCTAGKCGYSTVEDQIEHMFTLGPNRPDISYTLNVPDGCDLAGSRLCASFGQFVSTIVTLYSD